MKHYVVDLSDVPSDRSLASEGRLARRLDREVQEALSKLFETRAVTDLTQTGAVTVKVKLPEPSFIFDGETGAREHLIVGNPKFNVRDRIAMPPRRNGNGNGGVGVGESEDEFVFEMPTDELERRLFADLELPDMARKQLVRVSETVIERAGFTSDGPPQRLDLVRSAVRATGRRKALHRPGILEINRLEDELQALRDEPETTANAHCIANLEHELAKKRARRATSPFLDKSDLRYRRSDNVELPVSQAVIFNMMDVSGSMSEHHKKLAKQFFWLLRRLIALEYKEVDIVWIKHTDVAQEVDEHNFFFSRESGGTVVASALEKMILIQKERYPLNLWNIYCCQATDGDVWRGYNGSGDDGLESATLIEHTILPMVQYYAYVECWADDPGRGKKAITTPLWEAYEGLITRSAKFQMRRVHNPSQIYPVFANLFRERESRRRVAA
jgi:uncharacterized sporulation protein YeaH/YhbH (DUF444 family)